MKRLLVLGASFTPLTNNPFARLPLQPPNVVAQIPTHELRVPIAALQGASHDVLLLPRRSSAAKGSRDIKRPAPAGAGLLMFAPVRRATPCR